MVRYFYNYKYSELNNLSYFYLFNVPNYIPSKYINTLIKTLLYYIYLLILTIYIYIYILLVIISLFKIQFKTLNNKHFNII